MKQILSSLSCLWSVCSQGTIRARHQPLATFWLPVTCLLWWCHRCWHQDQLFSYSVFIPRLVFTHLVPGLFNCRLALIAPEQKAAAETDVMLRCREVEGELHRQCTHPWRQAAGRKLRPANSFTHTRSMAQTGSRQVLCSLSVQFIRNLNAGAQLAEVPLNLQGKTICESQPVLHAAFQHISQKCSESRLFPHCLTCASINNMPGGLTSTLRHWRFASVTA